MLLHALARPADEDSCQCFYYYDAEVVIDVIRHPRPGIGVSKSLCLYRESPDYPLPGNYHSVVSLPSSSAQSASTTLLAVHYYGYRFYKPGLGRWINRDPIGDLAGMSWWYRRNRLRDSNHLFTHIHPDKTQGEIQYALLLGGPNAFAFCLNNAINKHDVFGERFSIRCGVLSLQRTANMLLLFENRAQYMAIRGAMEFCQPGGAPPNDPYVWLGCELILRTGDDLLDDLDNRYWDLIRKIGDIEKKGRDLCCRWARDTGPYPRYVDQ